MKLRFPRFLMVLITLMSSASLQAETLVINGDEAYSPIIYLKEGKPAGILPAIFSRAEALTGDKYDLRLLPWRRAYETALRGEAGITNISFNQERSQLFDFSKPIYDDDIQIVVRKDRAFPYAKLDDLKGKVIGGLNGAAYGPEIDPAIAAGLFTVERDGNQVGRLRKVLAGRIDAAFIGNGNAGLDALLNSHEELRAHRDKFVVLPVPLARDPLHLAFAKGMKKQDALARFNAAIDKLNKSGELKKIANEASRQSP